MNHPTPQPSEAADPMIELVAELMYQNASFTTNKNWELEPENVKKIYFDRAKVAISMRAPLLPVSQPPANPPLYAVDVDVEAVNVILGFYPTSSTIQWDLAVIAWKRIRDTLTSRATPGSQEGTPVEAHPAPVDTPDEQRGLYGKYRVMRNDGSSGPGGKHENCQYYVLDITHDRHAFAALLAYEKSCRIDFPRLSADLRAMAYAMTQQFDGLEFQEPGAVDTAPGPTPGTACPTCEDNPLFDQSCPQCGPGETRKQCGTCGGTGLAVDATPGTAEGEHGTGPKLPTSAWFGNPRIIVVLDKSRSIKTVSYGAADARDWDAMIKEIESVKEGGITP